MLGGGVGLHGFGHAQLEGVVDDLPAGQVVPVHQGDGGTLVARAAGAPGAVQVGLLVLGHAVVNHVGHVVDVDTAGGHVGGDQDVDLAGAEGLQRLLAGHLVQVAVQGSGREAAVDELLGHACGIALGFGEDDGAAAARGAQDAANHLVLVEVVGAVDDLANRRLGLRGVLGVGGANAHGLGHVLARHGNHGAGHGGGEQHALTLLGQVAENLLHGGLEAQVQHFVGLVEDHDLDLLEVQETLLVQVDDAAGGAHDHFQAAAQQLGLRLNRHATVEGCDAGVAQLRGDGQVVAHLNGELAGGNQNQGLGCAGVLQVGPTLVVAADHALDGGQTEAEGLTGTGLGLTNDVLAGQGHGKGELLNGEGGGDAHFGEGVANILAYAEVREGLGLLGGFLRIRISHWTVSFYPARGVCRLPEGVGASASGAVQWPVDIESRPREILVREILPRTPRSSRSGGWAGAVLRARRPA